MNTNPFPPEQTTDQAQQEESRYDPGEWTPVIERAFFDRLDEQLGASAARHWPDGVENLIRQQLADLHPDVEDLVRNPMDAANVRFTTLAVAAFNVLEAVCGPDKAAWLVDDCLNTPLREQVLAGTAAMLDHAADPFTALVSASKEREEASFGPSFHFERPVDDHDTYVLDITRCLFHETLTAAGRQQLQPILCRFDLNWADAIDPARHHVQFARPVTFATGRTCRMCFTRLERTPGFARVPNEEGSAM